MSILKFRRKVNEGKMEISITTQEDELVVSLKVNWESREIEIIQDKDYKVTEVFAD